jgi:hypothetical protein
MKMIKLVRSSLVAVLLAGSCLAIAAPASADGIGVHIGGLGVGIGVSNDHYYDSHHRRHAYSYPADWASYHHPQSWYRSHPHWNDANHHDYYRN